VNRTEVRAAAAQLRAVLAEIEAGGLDASPALRARIEGAAVAFDVVTGADADTVFERLASMA